MKRGIFAVLLVCIFTLMGGGNVYAAEQINTFDCQENIIRDGICVENEDGSYTFTMMTESKARSNNAIEKVQETYTIIPMTDEAKENLKIAVENVRSSGGTTTLTDSDTAGCVSAYCTISWNSYTSNNREYLYLTSISGGYTAEGSGSYIASGVSVSEQTVTFGQSGFSADGNTVTQNTTKNIGTTARSFSYSIPSDWEPIAEDGKYAIMGANYVITLKRGTSTWTCDILNNY